MFGIHPLRGGSLDPRDWLGRPPYDVAGKTVLITGGGQGIGAALARLLDARGAAVAVIDIDAGHAEKVAADLRHGLAVAADVTDRDAMAAVIDEVVTHFGTLDVVVANAGIAQGPTTLRALDPHEFDRILAVNVTGVFNTVRPALDHVTAAAGHIVVVASCAAFAPGPLMAGYTTSKAAAETLARSLRVELAAGGATAGVAYFGLVDTTLVDKNLEKAEIGADFAKLLARGPLSRRESAAGAALTIADGIARRAPRTISPRYWHAVALLRGPLGIALETWLAADPRLARIIRQLEQRDTPANPPRAHQPLAPSEHP